MDAAEFRVLGPLEVCRGGRLTDLGRPKQRAVLAVLLIEANRVIPLDRLIDLLWDGEPPARATGALQVYISGLRRALEPLRPARAPSQVLITQPPGYLLRIDPGQLDACRFESLAALGHNLLVEGQPAAARRALTQALALWRGSAYADFAFEPFAQAEAGRLAELRAGALEDRIATDLVLGDHVAVTAELEALVVANPLRERLWAQLMIALYRSERQSEALRAYERARAVLTEELGLEPGPVLRRLQEDILRHSPALEWQAPSEEDAPSDRAGAPSPGPPTAGPPAGGGRRQLVGRHRELQVLEGVLAQAHGEGGLALISGEPGIGKTRLVEELVARATAAGAAVSWGRCHEGEGAPSFWPWVQVLRHLLRTAAPQVLQSVLRPGAGEIGQILPEVKELVPHLEAPAALDPAAARFRLHEAVCDVLAALAHDRPVLVVLDDLHWADVPSLLLTEYAAERLAGTGVLLVGTYRDVDPALGGPLAATLGALARHPSLHRLPLGGLTVAEVGAFMAETAGVEPSPQVATAVHARTDGNPFFVAELARLLASEHALDAPGALEGQVPAGVRDVIRRRLSRLPEGTNELLAVAAILGRDVDLRVLAAAGDAGEDDVIESIDASVAVGILVEDPAGSGRLRFSHALVQDTICAELGAPRRAVAHAKVAEALREVYGTDDARAAQLAHHLYQAAPVVGPGEAGAQALRAAEVAQLRRDYEQAEWHLRRALELVAMLPAGAERASRELDVQHRLAALLSVTEGYHSAAVAQAWERAQVLCRELGDTPQVLTSIWGLARLTRTRGQFDVSDQLGRELLELARGSERTGFALAGHESCGLAAFFTGDPATAAERLVEAVALSDRLADAPGTGALVLHPGVSCRAYLACARWILGDDETPDELLDTARRLARLNGQPIDEAVALLYSSKLASMRGDHLAAGRWSDEVRRVAETTAIGPLAPVGVVLNSWSRARTGEPGTDAAFSRALARLGGSGWRLAWTYFLALRADAAFIGGDLDRALAVVEQGLAAAEATGERYYVSELCRLKGEIIAASGLGGGDHAAAESEEALRLALTVATEQGAVAFRRRAEETLARLTTGGPGGAGRVGPW